MVLFIMDREVWDSDTWQRVRPRPSGLLDLTPPTHWKETSG